MNVRHLILFPFLILLFFSSCKKDKDQQSGDYTLLSGNYGAICSNSRDEIMLFGRGGDDHDSILVIVKTDMEGNILWEKSYSFKNNILPESVVANGQDEYFLSAVLYLQGPQYVFNYDYLLIKIEDNGDTVFTKSLEKSPFSMLMKITKKQENELSIFLTQAGHYTEMYNVTVTGEISFNSPIHVSSNNFLVEDWQLEDWYILGNHKGTIDSSSITIMQFNPSGVPINIYYLSRGNPMGNAFFSSTANEIFWLYPDGKNVGIMKTDLENHIIEDHKYQVTDQIIIGVERIEKIDGENYALVYNYDKERPDQGFCVLKISGEGEITGIHFMPIPDCEPYFFRFTGLKNGSIAALYQQNDNGNCGSGSCYELRIFK